MWLRTTGCAVILALGYSGAVQSQSVTLDLLLARGAAYVQDFVERFSNVVAEEHYLQETTLPKRRRVLRSDFLLVRYPGARAWLPFRDVFEVDGVVVRDAAQQDRLTKLFVEEPRDAVRRADEIARAGARYNVAEIGTLNNPLIALGFLQTDYQPRFRFNLANVGRDAGPNVKVVRFQEWQRPTILRTALDGDISARGLLWIDENTGRVVKTTLEVGPERYASEVVTTYRFDEDLRINVPAEMRDWYPNGRGEIRGVATYGRFRRFQVRTGEELRR